MRLKPYFSQIVHRVSHFMRLRGPLADDPTAQMLHALLLLIGVWTGMSWITTLHLAPITFARILNVAVLEASLAAALVVLRLGYFRSASIIHLAGVWLWATLILTFFDGVHSRELCSTCRCQSRLPGSSDIGPRYGPRVGA